MIIEELEGLHNHLRDYECKTIEEIRTKILIQSMINYLGSIILQAKEVLQKGDKDK